MMMTEQIELEAVVCASCDEVFWDWADSTYTMCEYCTDYEPLDFDEYGEEW